MQQHPNPDDPIPEERGTQDPAGQGGPADRTGPTGPQSPVTPKAPSPSGSSGAPPVPTTRASDADRDTVLSILSAAMANGRLDRAEHDARSEAALSARTLGELSPLTDDLPEAEAHAREARRAERRQQTVKERVTEWRSWLGAALIMNVIWVVSSVANGELVNYWPVYPLGIWGAILLAHTLHPADSPRPDRRTERRRR